MSLIILSPSLKMPVHFLEEFAHQNIDCSSLLEEPGLLVLILAGFLSILGGCWVVVVVSWRLFDGCWRLHWRYLQNYMQRQGQMEVIDGRFAIYPLPILKGIWHLLSW